MYDLVISHRKGNLYHIVLHDLTASINITDACNMDRCTNYLTGLFELHDISFINNTFVMELFIY